MVTQVQSRVEPFVQEAERAVMRPGWFRWSAVIAGAFVTLSLFTITGLLARGVGLDYSYRTAATTGQEFGAVIWGAIAAIICYGVGGWIAGRTTARGDGTANGIAVWSVVTTFFVLWLGYHMDPMLGKAALDVPGIGSASAAPVETAGMALTAVPRGANEPAMQAVRGHLQASAWWTIVALALGLAAALYGAHAGEASDWEPRRRRRGEPGPA